MHVFKILFAFAGMILFALFGPVRYDPRCPTVGYESALCKPGLVAMAIGGVIGLLGGALVDKVADVALATRRSASARVGNPPFTAPPTQIGGKLCTRCAAASPPEFSYCGNCGTPFVASNPPKPQTKCSHCGTVNEAEYRFCAVCGTPLTIPQVNT
jgi:RNA polymerase subunit RPABC4/transcription elongation factor Spt4